jgi:hypothetical protein
MSSDLSIFATRLREFISLCAGESEFASRSMEPALQEYYDAQFNGMTLVLSALQFTHNAAYRKFCEARRIFPNQLTHWTQIPAVPTSAFKELEFTSLTATERTKTFHSSGTTEHRPSRHFHSTESLNVYEESLWSWFRAHVIQDAITLRPLFLVPSPAQAAHSSLVHMLEVVRRRIGAPESVFLGCSGSDRAWTIDGETAIQRLREAVGDAVLVAGTAFSFVHLLDLLDERQLRFQLPSGSRVMETGGYKGRSRSLPKSELHALISDRLGIRPENIICEYGMSELSSQAYDLAIRSNDEGRPVERVFQFPPWARACVVSPETGREVSEGETGLLCVYDLANVFSVLALQTEDLAVRRAHGFELLGRAAQAEARGCSLMSHDAPPAIT